MDYRGKVGLRPQPHASSPSGSPEDEAGAVNGKRVALAVTTGPRLALCGFRLLRGGRPNGAGKRIRACRRSRIRRGADTGEDDRRGTLAFTKEAEHRFLDAFADRLEAELQRAGGRRNQFDAGAVLVEDLEAADRAPGDHSYERTSGHIAGLGDLDLAGRRRADLGDAEVGGCGIGLE